MTAFCSHTEYTRKSSLFAEFVFLLIDEAVQREEFPYDVHDEDQELEFSLLVSRSITDSLQDQPLGRYAELKRKLSHLEQMENCPTTIDVLSVDVQFWNPSPWRLHPLVDERLPDEHYFQSYYTGLRGVTMLVRVSLSASGRLPPRERDV